jgi:septal ring factor EnvC (AmiA/AmiB activator)
MHAPCGEGTFTLPNLRSLSRLRALLPYAAKLLPVLTGVAVGETALQQRPDLSALNRHFGEMQSESRGLRSRMEGQSEQIDRIQERLERVAASIESNHHEQQELAKSFRSLAGLLKGLFFAILFLLVAVTAMSVLILLHISHA